MLRAFKLLFYVLILGAVSICLTGLILWKAEGMRIYSVQTDSMAPVIRPGDLTISFRAAGLQAGDIISYRSPATGQNVTHRLTRAYPAMGFVITKGNNLSHADPAVPVSQINGRVVKVLPKLGYLIDVLRSPAGLIGLVYLPALALASYELSRLLNALSYKSYSLGG